jgi:hypothetical protein
MICKPHTQDLAICKMEAGRYRAWVSEHAKICPMQPKPTESDPLGWGGCTGPGLRQLVITPSTIGNGVLAKCSCGAEADITHVEHL